MVTLAACGQSGEDEVPNPLNVRFDLARFGQSVSCSEATEVDRVEVTLLRTDGITVLNGFPVEADCSTGQLSVDWPSGGEYLLDVTAFGLLDGDPSTVLYTARVRVSQPTPEVVDLTLVPEVSFLELEWTFREDGLAPCATEVGQVQVTVGNPGGQTPPYVGRFDCTETPVRLPRPFIAQEYLILVEALSPVERFRLFVDTVSRILVKGDNSYLAALQPLGGRLNIDWQFAVGMDESTDCDADFVGNPTVDIEVRSREGDNDVATAEAGCRMAPFAFTTRRYTQGRLLTVALTAEANLHRFEGQQDFIMPDGDYDTGRLTLHAVGTATLAVNVESASCDESAVTGYEVMVAGPTDFSSQIVEFDPATPSVALTGLWYGTYDIEIVQQTTRGAQCTAQGQRRIAGRKNDWAPLSF